MAVPGSPRIRRSPIAGSWYPADPGELRKEVENYLHQVPPITLSGDLIGLIAPHAGLIYSGPVAAYSYSLLTGRKIGRVLLLGPDHRSSFRGVLATECDFYQTPLGLVPVDRAMVDALARKMPLASVSHDMEHSLEMQLPFLQLVVREFSLIPLMLGDQSLHTVQRLVSSLTELLEPLSALIVGSTDLSHYYDSQTASLLDGRMIRLLEEYRPEDIVAEVEAGRTEACGYGAMAAALLLAREWGANRVQILRRSDSGAVSGDNLRVVGYLAAAILRA